MDYYDRGTKKEDLIKVYFGHRIFVVGKSKVFIIPEEELGNRIWTIGNAAHEFSRNHEKYTEAHFKRFARFCCFCDEKFHIQSSWIGDLPRFIMPDDVCAATRKTCERYALNARLWANTVHCKPLKSLKSSKSCDSHVPKPTPYVSKRKLHVSKRKPKSYYGARKRNNFRRREKAERLAELKTFYKMMKQRYADRHS
jgi:hypothetical protein